MNCRSIARARVRRVVRLCVPGALAVVLATGAVAQTPVPSPPPSPHPGEIEAADAPSPSATGDAEADRNAPFWILGHGIEPNHRRDVTLTLIETFAGAEVNTPVQIVRGSPGGPTLCLVAGIHGDEIVGIEVVRRVVNQLDPKRLQGMVIAVPIANPMGLRRSSRYLADRRDLNRYFPGRPTGSSAARIAYRIFNGVIRHCHVVVDFHSGSFHRANLPQVRANLTNPFLLGMAQWFRAPVVVHSEGRPGTLRLAAAQSGIQAVLYEAGEPMRFDLPSVMGGVRGTLLLMQSLGMVEFQFVSDPESEVYQGSHWVRAEEGGIFLSQVELGEHVKGGALLGTVTDPFTNERVEVRARATGRVIGRALDQVVIPGYALFNVGTLLPLPGVETDQPSEGDEPGPELEERPE